MLAAGLIHLRRLPGVLRPAIAVPIPARDGPSVLLDGGANADNRPEHLLQFGIMGAVFAEEILGIANPVVRLLSIGEEPGKGEISSRSARTAPRRRSRPRTSGQRRGPRPAPGAADVVVTDGFTGNIALKHWRAPIDELFDMLREGSAAPACGKLGGLLIRPAARRLRARLDPDTYGGAYLLGLRGLAVIAHGNSGRRAIANAIRLGGARGRPPVVERLVALAEHAAIEAEEQVQAPELGTSCRIGASDRVFRGESINNEVTWQRPAKRSMSVSRRS